MINSLMSVTIALKHRLTVIMLIKIHLILILQKLKIIILI